MAVTASSLITPQTPRATYAVCTTASTDRTDAAAQAVALYTAGANGARITRVQAVPRATVTVTELQLFRSLDAGTTRRLYKSKLMAAYTVAQTTQNSETDFGFSDANPLTLGPNEVLYCAIGVALAGGIVFTAEGADY